MAWSDSVKRSLGSCGENVFIDETVRFARPNDVHLGNRTRIAFGCYISTPLHTFSDVQIEPMAVLAGRQAVIMENWTFVGFHSRIFTTSEDYSGEHGPVNQFWGKNRASEGVVQFKDHSGIASNVTVFPGVLFPEGATVGADSMVRSADPLVPWFVHYRRHGSAHLAPWAERNQATVIAKANDPAFRHIGGEPERIPSRDPDIRASRDAA